MTASDSIQKAQTCGQKCVCGNMWKLSKDVATLQLLLQLVATSGSAAIFVVFLIINCGVSGSMQSEKELRGKGIVAPPCHINDLET